MFQTYDFGLEFKVRDYECDLKLFNPYPFVHL